MDMAIARGRPRASGGTMRKTSIQLTEELIESLREDAQKSGFKHWSEQARCELMKPRGMWKEIVPYLPTQGGPKKGLS